MSKANLEYGDANISSLKKWYEPFQLRSEIYIGEVGHYGVMHLLKETVSNSIDEHINGHGDHIIITIDTRSKDGYSFQVEDSGRGIPLGKMYESITVPFTSGKYGDLDGQASGGYSTSGGLNGVGMTLTAAISNRFTAQSTREGKRRIVELFKGEDVSNDIKAFKGNSGTIIKYCPNPQFIGNVNINSHKKDYFTYAKIMSYINPGLKFTIKWDNDKPKSYLHSNGIVDYFNKIVKEKKMRLMGDHNFIQYRDDKGTGYHIVYGFMASGGGNYISYLNGIHTAEGGVHVSALTDAFGILTAALNKGGYIPKGASNKYKITGNEIKESLFAIVVGEKAHPLKFSNQTKTKFISEDYRPAVVPNIKEEITKWMNNNKALVDKIGQHCAILSKVRWENSNNKNKALKAGTSRTDLFKNIDVDKFTPCNINDPSRCELFLCEGDSAANPVKSGRNSDYQALMPLRGKVKNMIQSSVLSDELKTLIKIMGAGEGANKDIRKMMYSKIIILTDADVDGEFDCDIDDYQVCYHSQACRHIYAENDNPE